MAPELVADLVRAIERKDFSTAAHTWRVVLYTRALAERLGVERDIIGHLTRAAALHDVGKIDIPSSILRKPGRLTPEEFEVIKAHTTLGYDRLVRLGEDDPRMLNLVRHHHERWDGLGYPDGLRGEDIPLGARYFSVIDAFDAMTSVRPYRREIGEEAAEEAIAEIERGIGTRYCEEPARAFIDLYRTGEIEWILHYVNDDAALPECPPEDETERAAEQFFRPR